MTATVSVPRSPAQDLMRAPAQQTVHDARIAGVGTAVTSTSYSQQELLDAFGITDPKVCSVFLGSAIRRR
jgi:3,5-dihydroxyphenylacetyl-CoA synthase